MIAFKAFVAGSLMVWQRRKLWLGLYVCNLIFALVLIIPARSLLARFFADRLAGGTLAEQFNFAIWAVFLKQNFPSVSLLFNLMFVLGIIYWLFNAFLNGGILMQFVNPEQKFNLGSFLTTCCYFFVRFFRLLLIGLGVIVLVFLLSSVIFALVGLLAGNIENEIVKSLLRLLAAGSVLLILLFFNMILDYAKIITVVWDELKVLKAVRLAMGFVRSNFGKTLILYFGISFLALILLVLYFSIHGWLKGASAMVILATFLLQQIYIISKLGIRLDFFASQMYLYRQTSGIVTFEPIEIINEA